MKRTAVLAAFIAAGFLCAPGRAQTRVTQYAVVKSSHFVLTVYSTSVASVRLSDIIPDAVESTFIDLYLLNFDTAAGDVYYRLDGTSTNVATSGIPVVAKDENPHRVPFAPKGNVLYLQGASGSGAQTVRGLLVIRSW